MPSGHTVPEYPPEVGMVFFRNMELPIVKTGKHYSGMAMESPDITLKEYAQLFLNSEIFNQKTNYKEQLEDERI